MLSFRKCSDRMRFSPSEAERGEVKTQNRGHQVSDDRAGLTGMEEETEPEGRDQSAELTHHEVHLQRGDIAQCCLRTEEGEEDKGQTALQSGPPQKTSTNHIQPKHLQLEFIHPGPAVEEEALHQCCIQVHSIRL